MRSTASWVFQVERGRRFSGGSKDHGLGHVCLRDDTAIVRMARTSWHPIRLEVKEGEALGLFEAIQWAISLNLSNVNFEVDSKVVVDNVLDAIEFGTIIEDCRRLFSLNPTFGVGFVRRQANVVAHSLGKGGYVVV